MTRTITKTNQKQSIYKRPKWIKTYLTNIKSKISENNYDLLNRYNDDMIISSMSDVTRHKNLSHFGLLTLMLDNDWKESVENDYRSIVSKIMIKHGNNGKETGYSHALKISLRSIVRFLSTNSRKKPETGEVSTIKFLTLIKPKDTLTREDLPTDEEVKKLILACADSARDKAMLSVHAEAGTRIGELLGMSIKDVTIDKYGAIIKVDGKTGVRPIRIVNSVPHLTKWINNHPDNLQLLCRRCNYLKNPRLSEREPFDMCECEPIQHVSFSYHTNEITINKEKEPLFRKYVEDTIDKNKEWEKEDLINSGSETVGVSIITAKRYFKKMCSSTGKFMLVTKNNTDYVTKRNQIII